MGFEAEAMLELRRCLRPRAVGSSRQILEKRPVLISMILLPTSQRRDWVLLPLTVCAPEQAGLARLSAERSAAEARVGLEKMSRWNSLWLWGGASWGLSEASKNILLDMKSNVISTSSL